MSTLQSLGLREEVTAALRAAGVPKTVLVIAADAVVDVENHDLAARQEQRTRIVMAGGPGRLATDLVAAMNAAHGRVIQDSDGDRDVAYEAGHDRSAIFVSRAVAELACAGWYFGRAYEMAFLPSVRNAIREIAIAAEVLHIGGLETRRVGMLADCVHAATDELDSLHRDGEDVQ